MIKLRTVLLLVLLGVLLYWHAAVGLTRFFDVDEFTHLHWASNMARGSRPYVDFFTFFTPGFYWFLAPLFWVFGTGVSLFIASRVAAIAIFFGIVALTGLLFRLIRSTRWFLLPMILLAFLPMPYDKFTEIRPDNLATLLGLAGVVLEVVALIRPPRWAGLVWFLAGVMYAASMVVLVKTLPFVAVGVLVAVLDANIPGQMFAMVKRRKLAFPVIEKKHRMFLAGLAAPSIIFVVWAVSLGNLDATIYSLTRMPFEANTIGRIFIMEPHLFFFPNGAFYGGWGMTTALILNHLLWAVGAVVGCYRFLTPYVTAGSDKKRVLAEVLVGTIFILSVIGYINFFPLKHSQYLIPIAIFIAFYAADVLAAGFVAVGKKWGSAPIFLFVLVGVFVLWQQAVQVNAGKLTLSNVPQLETVKLLKDNIPSYEEVFDLEGRMIYWRDPYYICCLPMGTFTRFLSRPPAPIAEVLEAKKVPYIFQGTSGRLWELSGTDLNYINANYEKVGGWGDQLWKRKP